jgi:hypothetical protein
MAEKDAKKPKPAAADSALDDQEYNEICLARLGNMEDKTLTPILKAWQGLIGDYDQHSPEVRGTKVNEIRRLLALYDLRHLAFGECLANRQETDAARANEIAQQTQADTAAFAGLYGELEGARVQRRKRMEAEMMAKEIATKKSRTEIGEQLKASRQSSTPPAPRRKTWRRQRSRSSYACSCSSTPSSNSRRSTTSPRLTARTLRRARRLDWKKSRSPSGSCEGRRDNPQSRPRAYPQDTGCQHEQ